MSRLTRGVRLVAIACLCSIAFTVDAHPGTFTKAPPPPPPASAPANLTAKAGNARVVLEWNAVAGAAGYQIFRSGGGGAWQKIATTTALTYTSGGLVNGTTYSFHVAAYNGGGGTDHAWGSHHLVLGGSVHGGQTYGSFPLHVLGGPDDAEDRGNWIPTTSLDQYAATLGSWFGVADADLNVIFPNLRNFPSGRLAIV